MLSPIQIREALEPFGVTVSDEIAGKVRAYLDLLLRWNRKVNLTAICKPDEILRRHFGESMFAAVVVPIMGGTLADIGSGAGFPGLAIKLVRPELAVRLIEPVGKKRAFLGEVVRTLELKNVELDETTITRRKRLKAPVDWITARALGDFRRLLSWADGSLRDGGRIVLWLGNVDAAMVKKARGWNWSESIAIPQSRESVVLVGSVFESVGW